MQAIRTRGIAPTATRNARISAQCGAGRIVVVWDHQRNLEQNHANAARALRDKLGWTQAEGYAPLFGGGFESDFFWVFAQEGERL